RERRRRRSPLRRSAPGNGRKGYFDVGFEISVDAVGRGTLRKRGGPGRVRHLSLGTVATPLVTKQNGRNRCGGGGAGSPPFTADALEAGGATGSGGGGKPDASWGGRWAFR